MTFGFPPKYSEEISFDNLNKEQFSAFALGAIKDLKWSIEEFGKDRISAHSSISLSSEEEEITIEFHYNSATVESKCLGMKVIDSGKNRANIKKFIASYKKVSKNNELSSLLEQATKLENVLSSNQEELKEENEFVSGGFISLFKIQENYIITPIVVNLNIAVFILMLLSGTNIFEPSSEVILKWGANFRPLTLEKEWWRLFTSCFIHIGIMHLLMNMYALLYVGFLLEPHLGSTRFSVAYILSGLSGSIASMYWHEMTISAGASGAIFGLYGIFLAMLSTRLIEDEEKRKALLLSIGIFVVYNLINGMQAGIDNAAHIGGLIGGLCVGYIYYISLRKPENKNLKIGTTAFAVLFLIATSFAVYANTSSDLGIYQQNLKKFSVLEMEAIQGIQFPQEPSKDSALFALRQRGIPKWREAIQLIDETENLDLPEEIHKRNRLLRQYCEIRIRSYEHLCIVFEGNGEMDSIEKRMIDQQLINVMNEIDKAFGKK